VAILSAGAILRGVLILLNCFWLILRSYLSELRRQAVEFLLEVY
jgi:hypothetical protein